VERLLAGHGLRPGRRLARAYLNRAHDALKAGRPQLARVALDRALHLSPSVLGSLLSDPRLAAQMAVLRVSPERAARWFSR